METHGPLGTLWVSFGLIAFYLALIWLNSLLGIFLTGSFLIERVFSIQGGGLLAFEAIPTRDFPVVLGFLVISSVLLMLGNLVSDLAVALVDPRVRFE